MSAVWQSCSIIPLLLLLLLLLLPADIPCIDGVGAAAPKPGPLDKLTGLINRKGDPAAMEYDDIKVSHWRGIVSHPGL
jgi:hypothetical protein